MHVKCKFLREMNSIALFSRRNDRASMAKGIRYITTIMAAIVAILTTPLLLEIHEYTSELVYIGNILCRYNT